MPYKFSKKYPTSARVIIACLAMISDMVVVCASGIVMIFAMYFFTGLTADRMMLMGPSLMTECAVQHCYASRFLTYPKYKQFNKRSSKYVAFMVYYGYIWITAYASVYVTKEILDFIWYPRDGSIDTPAGVSTPYNLPVNSMIALHQVLTFVTLTSHNLWFKGKLLEGADPFAAAVLQCIVTWIIFGIWALHAVLIDNVGQMGGFIQWIPLTNLMSVSVFNGLNLEKVFKNTVTRGGYLALLTNLVNIGSWLVCYGITYALWPEEWKSGHLSNGHIGHSIWAMAAISWPAYQTIGFRLNPVICKKMCLDKNKNIRWGMSILYFMICSALALGIGTVFYIFWNRFLFDVLICDVLNYKNGDNKCVEIAWHSRPAYFFGFGIGTQFICYVETKEDSRDAIHDEVHEEKAHQVEAGIDSKGLESTATTVCAIEILPK
ncbi:Transmembrane_domain-containing protein [Hexamita inflata]|uniref:Transmembrane domain-containing protein n=1 Tax=Hexamita inflata TaxID=28002 RepID=A0AA86U271_9EUKA|nr:Transmembrane domain-containing protein [Hexamita inflata]